MRAAIYVRKSTEQKSTDERELSTRRQEADCRAFCERKGWKVAGLFDEGDGVSGTLAEEDRPELSRLIAAAKSTPRPFDVIVAWNEDRISREGIPYLTLLDKLDKLGLKVWYADKDREAKIEEFGDIIVEAVNAGRAREHARVTAKDTRAGRVKRFREIEAWCSGRAPYGYRGERQGDIKTGHTVLVIEPDQAAVVQRIFKLIADGQNIRVIRSQFNAERVPAPTRDKQRSGEWAVWSVTKICRNRTYIGETSLNGETRQSDSLRIIKQPLWEKVQRVLDANVKKYSSHRDASGRLSGRPEGGRLTQYLYSDLLVCGSCGSKLWVIPNRGRAYARCKKSVKKGTCANKWGVPYPEIRDAITKAIGRVTPEQIEALYEQEHARAMANVGELEIAVATKSREVEQLGVKIKRLIAAIEDGQSVGATLKTRQAELDAAEVALVELEARRSQEDISGFDWQDWQGWLQEVLYLPLESIHLEELEGNVEAGRLVLKLLLPNPVVVTPVAVDGKLESWTFKATVATDPLVNRSVVAGKSTVTRRARS
jgi:DNA invertase Pin-like site-specific DNA recombinase